MDVVENETAVIAAALNFTHGQTIYYYMGGFDVGDNKLSPGNALFAEVIQRGMQNGYTTYDFLRGKEPYKYKWGASDTPNFNLSVYPVGFFNGTLPWALTKIRGQLSERLRKRSSNA